MYHNWELFIGVLCVNYCHTLLSLSVFSMEGQCTLQLLRLICLQIIELSAGCPAENMISNSNILTYYTPSSETQGQSVGRGEKARRKFSSMGGKAPGYRLSQDHLQTVKRMLSPDWAQKSFVLLCPIDEQYLLSSFRELVHDVYCLDHRLSAPKKCTQSGTSIQWISQKS